MSESRIDSNKNEQPVKSIHMNDDDDKCDQCAKCFGSIPTNFVANSNAIIGCCKGTHTGFLVCPAMCIGTICCCCCCCTFEAEKLLPG